MKELITQIDEKSIILLGVTVYLSKSSAVMIDLLWSNGGRFGIL